MHDSAMDNVTSPIATFWNRPEAGKIINFVAFQVCWLACVWGAANGWWWLGPLAVLAFGAWQLNKTHVRDSDLRLVGIAALLGFLVDSGFILAGLVEYASPTPWTDLAPVWIIAMWIGFALTLNHSMDWLAGKPWLAAGLGAIGGPMAYYVGGMVWGAMTFEAPLVLVLVAIGVVWAAVTPVLMALTTGNRQTLSRS